MYSTKRTAKIRQAARHANIEPLEMRLLLSASPTVQLSLTATPAQDISGSPSGLSPAMIEQAYDLDNIVFTTSDGHTVGANGEGETIAIVDAYGDPNISSDLETFDANFGLSNDNADGQFVLTVATPQGSVSNNSGWDTEQSLDVEWAHAIAPDANILLVETPSDSVSSLTEAVAWAADQPGVVAVSMSWGDSPEFAGETAYDHDFLTPSGHEGVTFVAASGDDAEPNYPSTSPDVLAVGGTTLTVNDSGDWILETDWADSGGGVSPYEGTDKPDVSYDANPDTGFLVYDSVPSDGEVGWQVVGGTSAGSPQWAAIIALVDQGRALRGLGSLDGSTQTIPDLYDLPSSDFNVVLGGGLTGLGSPIGESIISALVGGNITSTGSSPGVASQLAFVSQPTNTQVGSVISPAITVDVEDSDGNIVTSDDSDVTLSLASGSGTLGGTLTEQAVDGVATFSDITLSAAGDYTLEATDGSLQSATSSEFAVATPNLAFTQQPLNSVAGVAFTPAISVSVENSGGDVLSSDDTAVTLSIISGPSGATLSGTTSVTAVSGVATFSDLILNTPGTYELKASGTGVNSADSDVFTITEPKLVFIQQPTDTVTGMVVSPLITVAIENSAGNVVTSDESTVTLSILTGPAGGTLGGTLSVAAYNGIATFSDVTLNISAATPGIFALEASDGARTKGTSAGITVVPVGWVDTANWDEITGWAVDPTDPTASINVEVEIVNGPTQIFAANESRGDLVAYVGSANHGFTYGTPMLTAGSHTVYIYAIETNGSKVLLATDTIVSQNSLFDENYYLTEYPNVAAAVAKGEFTSGYQHYLEYGQYEGYNPNPYWDESWYLEENPDVAAAVKAGTVSSGFMQYYLYGQYEGRGGLLYFNTTYYLDNNADVAAAVKAGTVTSAFQHFCDYGQYEGRSPMLYFSSSVYDAHNSDILPYVTGEPLESDYEHFILYGQYENRLASDYFNQTIYLEDNPQVTALVDSGQYADVFQEWLEVGQYEDLTAV
jgi:hypothetical protein